MDQLSKLVSSASSSTVLTKNELERYHRHLILDEVGINGQIKLKSSKVLIIGTGGLGSPIAIYLAAVGIGTIGLVDADTVEYSNLQRQIIHGTSDIGRSKLESAKESILNINPNINVKLYNTYLNEENALSIIESYDIIVDGTDNFPTRYLVNDSCVILGKPNIYGSIFKFEGQVTVFDAKLGPCYRCVYPEPPSPGDVPSCAEGGVIGILPGMIGIAQANEVIKLVLEIGNPLIGHLLLIDALDSNYRNLNIQKDKNCPICGENPTITSLINYNEFCGLNITKSYNELQISEFLDLIKSDQPFQLIDVREPFETEVSVIPKATIIPLNDLLNNIDRINRDIPVIIYCKSGVRSAIAITKLQKYGFYNLHNLIGGIEEWKKYFKQLLVSNKDDSSNSTTII